ncbi:hypothetical protein NIA69_20510 [Gemmiger formicilis]|nr:hypothetical protein [Gemmiger formicilis]
MGLSLRQLACFAAAAVLAIATCFVCLHWLRMDMQVVSISSWWRCCLFGVGLYPP